jgi:hypothetical protein
MSEISQLLASVYHNDTPQPSPEDQEKIAAAQLFTDLCKEQGIDVNELKDEQIDFLWKTAMEGSPEGEGDAAAEPPKDAEPPAEPKTEDPKTDPKAEDKEAAAKEEFQKKQAAANEWQEKRAAAEKIAEADALGRIMAHAYVDELRKLASDAEGGGAPPPFVKKEEKSESKCEKCGKADCTCPAAKEESKEGSAENESQKKANAIIAEMEKNKQASAPQASTTSNLDELSAYRAVEILKSAGVDPDLAFQKINAAFTLGLPESTKIAQAQSYEQGLEVRALEFCEKAGFPVNWTQE